MDNIDLFFLDKQQTVLEAMQKMDVVAKKVLFVIENEKLVAALSDGDIRRWILSGGGLQESIEKIANFSPKYIKESEHININKYMKQKKIEALPVVDEELKVVQIYFWDDEVVASKKKKINLPVVIMAGGMGTRLYPYTKILPKPLIPVGELPISEIIMDKFHDYGCDRFYLIVNHKKNMIKAYFGEVKKEYSIEYADEDKPLGTGGGLGLLKNRLDTTFILSNCDILIEEDISKIYKQHKQENNAITMVCSLKNFRIPYGVVEFGEHGSISQMKEKPSISFFTNTGCYIVEPYVLDEIKEDENIDFPDIIQRCKDKGMNVGVFPINEKQWMDMGQLEELKKMEDRLRGEVK